MLPLTERISILTKRIENLKIGSGNYADENHRNRAIVEAENALDGAIEERAFEDSRKRS